MQLFYSPDIDEQTQQYAFSRDESKHIVKVLRKTVGDVVQITNGKGWLFQGKVMVNDVKNCVVKIG